MWNVINNFLSNIQNVAAENVDSLHMAVGFNF